MNALRPASPEAWTAYHRYSIGLRSADQNTARAHAYRLMPANATEVEMAEAWEIAVTAWFSRQKRVA